MSLANKITVGRAVLIPPIIVLLFFEQREVALILFLAACAGDVLDGMAARRRHEVSTLGKVLDPTVDKLLYAAVVSSLFVKGVIPLTWLVLFFIPQVGLGVGAAFLHTLAGRVQGARVLGKGSAVLTFLAVALMLARVEQGLTLFCVAVGLTYLSSLDYLIAALRRTKPSEAE